MRKSQPQGEDTSNYYDFYVEVQSDQDYNEVLFPTNVHEQDERGAYEGKNTSYRL